MKKVNDNNDDDDTHQGSIIVHDGMYSVADKNQRWRINNACGYYQKSIYQKKKKFIQTDSRKSLINKDDREKVIKDVRQEKAVH